MSQIKRKFIEDNSVSGSKIRLDNNEMFRSRNAANAADVNILKVTTADKAEFQTLPEVSSALAVPSALKQLATVEYIQNYLNAKGDVKDAVQAISDVQLALTGSSPLVVDGVTLLNDDRVGLVGQTSGAENGIYTVTISGGTYTLARSTDAAVSSAVTNGMNFVSTGGTVYAGYEALLTTADPIVLGTTSLVFVLYPTVLNIIAGDMLQRSGNTLSVDLAPLSGLESTNAGNVAGQLRAKVDTAGLEKDQTTRRDPTTGAIVAKKSKKATYTLNATDISNGYVDLVDVAGQDSVNLAVAGAGEQLETFDYSVNYTGGASSKTRVTFLGGLASAGVSALASGDIIVVKYTAF